MDVTDKSMEDRIFEAATQIFLEKGMDGARMQDIGNRAGINKSLLNYYYRSKDRLFNAVFEMIAMKMLEKFAPLLESNLTTEEKMQFFFDEHMSFFQQNPRLPLFLLTEISRHPERVKKFFGKLDYDKIFTLFDTRDGNKHSKNGLSKESVMQLLTIIIPISIFPFLAKGVLDVVLDKQGVTFNDFVEHRKKFAFEFVLAALNNLELK